MSQVTWVVQANLGNEDDMLAIKTACEKHDHAFIGVIVIPFSDEIPQIEAAGPIIAYGATRFIKNVADAGVWHPGAWFDENILTVENYLAHYGESMLNSDVLFMPLRSAAAIRGDDDLFVRPNKDLKEFAGTVMSSLELRKWASKICEGGYEIDPDILIAISQPKPVDEEYRCFVVNGKVVASTLYRRNFRLSKSGDVPQTIISFAEERMAEWSPFPAVAIDVSRTESGLRVIELTGINSAGFYAANIEDIISSVSAAL